MVAFTSEKAAVADTSEADIFEATAAPADISEESVAADIFETAAVDIFGSRGAAAADMFRSLFSESSVSRFESQRASSTKCCSLCVRRFARRMSILPESASATIKSFEQMKPTSIMVYCGEKVGNLGGTLMSQECVYVKSVRKGLVQTERDESGVSVAIDGGCMPTVATWQTTSDP